MKILKKKKEGFSQDIETLVDEKTVSTLDVLADVEVATILEHLVDEHENVDSETVSEENLKEYNELPFHVVAKGESFFSISKKYNIYMYNLERWNDFKRTQILRIGDVIYLADPKKPDNIKSKAK